MFAPFLRVARKNRKEKKEKNEMDVLTARPEFRLKKKKEKLEIHKQSFIDFASYDNIVDSRVIFTIFG